jgi:hydroxymethylbilane synthase
VAGYANMNEDGKIVLTALVASPDGKTIYKEKLEGTDPEQLGVAAADYLIDKGAKTLIDAVKKELEGE